MASINGDCNAYTTGLGGEISAYPEKKTHVITADLSSSDFVSTNEYRLTAERGIWGSEIATTPYFNLNQDISSLCNNNNQNCISVTNKKVTWTMTMTDKFKYGDGVMSTIRFDLVSPLGTVGNNQCDLGEVKLTNNNSPDCKISMYQEREDVNGNSVKCYISGVDSCVEPGLVTVNTSGLSKDNDLYQGLVKMQVGQTGSGIAVDRFLNIFSPGKATGTIPTNEIGKYTLDKIYIPFPATYTFSCNTPLSFYTTGFCEVDDCSTDEVIFDNDSDEEEDKPFELCNQILDPTKKESYTSTIQEQYEKCIECFVKDVNGDGQGDGVWTAIGCVDTSSTEGIVGKLMTVGMNIAGGIALLMILAAAFMLSTSEGELKRTSEAKEILTSAIIGLIFIIFSVTILQFIGVNILHIPGFGE